MARDGQCAHMIAKYKTSTVIDGPYCWIRVWI